MEEKIRTVISYDVWSRSGERREWGFRCSFDTEEKAIGYLKSFLMQAPASEGKVVKVESKVKDVYYQQGFCHRLFDGGK